MSEGTLADVGGRNGAEAASAPRRLAMAAHGATLLHRSRPAAAVTPPHPPGGRLCRWKAKLTVKEMCEDQWRCALR